MLNSYNLWKLSTIFETFRLFSKKEEIADGLGLLISPES